MKLEHITKAYSDKVIFSDFSLALPKSGAVTLMGPSGCGKTTLLRILCGLETPDSGHVEAENARIAVVFQEPRLLPHKNACDNLRIATGCSEQQACELLQELGFDPTDCKKYPAELSGGMQQRVSIARAILFGGDIYVLDEAFKGVEEILRKQLIERFKKLSQNALVVQVTHQRDEAELLGGEIITLAADPCRVAQRGFSDNSPNFGDNMEK